MGMLTFSFSNKKMKHTFLQQTLNTWHVIIVFLVYMIFANITLNSLWPSNAIWWYSFGLTSAQPHSSGNEWPFAWWHQALTWTNIDLSWVIKSHDIHLMVISLEMQTNLKISCLKFNSNIPGANELRVCCKIMVAPMILTAVLTLVVLRMECSCKTRSIPSPWLLMPWPLVPPGHQQPWYWLCMIDRSFYFME